jgi:hypothetical protein
MDADIKRLIDHWSAILAHSSGPLTPLETNNLRDVLRRSRVEIERLEVYESEARIHRREIERLESLTALQVRELAEFRVLLEECRTQCREQRSAKNQARADLLKVTDRLNAYTDRMITAGLMS